MRRPNWSWRQLLPLLALQLAGAGPACGARILAVFQLNGYSHFLMYERLLKELAARGHQVDVVSHFPQDTPVPNYTDMSVRGSLPDYLNSVPFEMALSFGDTIATFKFFFLDNLEMCEEVFKQPLVQQLLKSEEHYDLVVTEIFGVDCMLGFGHKFGAPVVSVFSSVLPPWANDRFGNPDHPAYVPVFLLPLQPPLHFAQRVLNVAAQVFWNAGCYLVGDWGTEAQGRRVFGDASLPSLASLQRNVSLLLVNSHFSMQQARPLVPNVVEVAGLHIQDPKPLPKDLQRFMDEAEHGVVYFSLGSMVLSETMPPAMLRAFVDVFKALPQRVVWKCDGGAVPDLPPNVYTATWFPQNDVMSHPKMRAFITHAGLMGTQEAVQYGVPMVAMPLFGDQPLNAVSYAHKGVAVVVDPRAFSRQQLSDALRTVLHDPGYRERARALSRVFRDRPQTPLETAAFWTEYVLRHRGAPHLRSAAVGMPWYQYLLLDVAAVLAALLALAGAALWQAARALADWRAKLKEASRPPVKRNKKGN